VLAGDTAGSRSSGLLREDARGGVDAAVLGEGDVKPAVVPLAGEGQEDKAEERNQEHVQDAEEDEVGSDGDLVTTIRETPGDRVEQPEQIDPAAEEGVIADEADALGANGALVSGVDCQDDPGDGAESEESPLVVGGGVGTDKVADDPGPGEEDIVGDGGPRDARQQAHGQDDAGEGNDPVDVLGEEDLAAVTVVKLVGGGDDRPAKIRGHGEVADGADEQGNGKDVVEDFLARAGKVA
jgi:hypothetical protein